MSGLAASTRIGVASLAALSLVALTACFPLKTDRPTSSTAPSQSASPDPDAQATEIPDADLLFEADADLPKGLAVSLESDFSGRDWEDLLDMNAHTYMHVATKCTVTFSTETYEADTDDDLEATREFVEDRMGVDVAHSSELLNTYPDDTSGTPGTTSPTRRAESIGYYPDKAADSGAEMLTARAITATTSVIIIELKCPSVDDFDEFFLDAHERFTIRLHPAG